MPSCLAADDGFYALSLHECRLQGRLLLFLELLGCPDELYAWWFN